MQLSRIGLSQVNADGSHPHRAAHAHMHSHWQFTCIIGLIGLR